MEAHLSHIALVSVMRCIGSLVEEIVSLNNHVVTV